MKRKVNKYKKAGVNIDRGNQFIRLIKKRTELVKKVLKKIGLRYPLSFSHI